MSIQRSRTSGLWLIRTTIVLAIAAVASSPHAFAGGFENPCFRSLEQACDGSMVVLRGTVIAPEATRFAVDVGGGMGGIVWTVQTQEIPHGEIGTQRVLVWFEQPTGVREGAQVVVCGSPRIGGMLLGALFGDSIDRGPPSSDTIVPQMGEVSAFVETDGRLEPLERRCEEPNPDREYSWPMVAAQRGLGPSAEMSGLP